MKTTKNQTKVLNELATSALRTSIMSHEPMPRAVAFAVLACASATNALSLPTLHDFGAKAIGGDAISFSAYKGKPVLVLNVAAI